MAKPPTPPALHQARIFPAVIKRIIDHVHKQVIGVDQFKPADWTKQ